MTQKIKTFTDLLAWQRGRDVTLAIYQITDKYPPKEIYSLTNQMRRAAVSVASNIAEGFARNSKLEKKQFYTTAKSSLVELQNQLIISMDIGYLNRKNYQKVYNLTIQCSKLLTGLIRSITNK